VTIHPGLVSITFRQLSPPEIIRLAEEAGLECIEWGGDLHVPHGDLPTARHVKQMTTAAGLRVASYGSYYRVWPQEPCSFEKVLETAVVLGAPVIRIWAGKASSAEISLPDRARLVDEIQHITRLAQAQNIVLAFEYHGGTLTDTLESARDLMIQTGPMGARFYWQPPVGATISANLAGLQDVLPWLANLHVFHWQAAPAQRLPLADGAEDWRRYLKLAASAGGERDALLEFVRGDAPSALMEDAAVLIGLLREVNNQA
jgi:sugar phosphate isomerase/epimerase